MKTVNDGIEAASNNFTLLRLLSAISVLYYHCYPLSLGRGQHDPITLFLKKRIGIGLGGLAVGTFFIISGFLITASFSKRQNILTFVESRMLRIFPGLIVGALFCATIVGSLTTTIPLYDYFTDERTYRFVFKNSTLFTGVQFDLPGVFKSNPWMNGVNGSLWTLPVEIYMYMWIGLLGVLGILSNRNLFNSFFLLGTLIYIASPETFPITNVDGSVRNPLFFFIGAFTYINRKNIPINSAIIIVLSIFIFVMPGASSNMAITSIYIAYIIFYIAFSEMFLFCRLDKFGDISYGVYIYSFPIQQALAHFIDGITPSYMFILALPIVVFISILSWRFIEKPTLKLKGMMSNYKRLLGPPISND